VGFLVTTQQVVIMFLLMAVGVLATKRGWLNQSAATGLTNLLMYIVTPSVILQAFHRRFDPARFRDFGIVLGLDLASYLLIWGISFGLFNRRLVTDPLRRRALRFGTIYSNAGFLGIPLAQALLGRDGVFFAVTFLIAFTLFVWTQGYRMFPNTKELGQRNQLTQLARNPNLLAVAAGLVLFIGSVPLPGIVVSGLGYLAVVNVPLSMLIVGRNLASLSWRDFLGDRWVWAGTAARNLIVPAICLGLLTFVPLDVTTRLSILIPLSCPVATFLILFSVMRQVDAAFATRLMFTSTLVSVVSLPAVLTLAQAVW